MPRPGAVLAFLVVGLSAATLPARTGRLTLDPVTPHLPQETVNTISVDGRGFVWIGTLGGLCRWDGVEAVTFTHDPDRRESISGNDVQRLAWGSDGSLWIATPEGIDRFLGPLRGFSHTRRLGTVVRDGAGTVWVLSGSDLLRACGNTLHRQASLPEDMRCRGPSCAAEADPRGGVWAWATPDTLFHWDPQRHRWRGIGLHPAPARVERFAVGRDAVWLSWNRRLFRCPRNSSGGMVCREVPVPEHAREGIVRLVPAEGGTLWLATTHGALHLDARGRRLAWPDPGGETDGPASIVRTVHPHPGGGVWLGTITGLFRWRRRPPFVTITSAEGLPGDFVTSILERADGTILVGSLGGGITVLSPRLKASGPFSRRHGLDDDWVWSLAEDDGGRLWVGTQNGLVFLPRGGGRARRVRLGSGLAAVTCLAWDAPRRILWAGTSGKGLLAILPDRLDTPVTAPPWPAAPRGRTTVRAILPTTQCIWVGTDEGLLRLDGRNPTRAAPDPGPATLGRETVWDLAPGTGGTLWIGTSAGLYSLDPSGQLRHVLTPASIPGGSVYRIERGRANQLWLSTNHGLERFDPEKGRTSRFGAADGLGVLEFNRGASCRLHDGRLVFGGNRGLVVVTPAEVTAPRRPPPPQPVRAELLDARGWGRVRIAGDRLVLPPDTLAVRLTFASPELEHPSAIVYRFRLGDTPWLHAGPSRSITLTRSRAGRIVLEAEAAVGSGPWSAPPSRVDVFFRPRLWERPAARVGFVLVCAALLAAAGALIAQRRARHRLALAAERERLAAEKARISRDLHDEMGARLTTISFMAELASRPDIDAAQRRSLLVRMGESARDLLQSLDSFVWAVNPRNDELPALAAYLREEAARLIEPSSARALLQIAPDLPDLPVRGEIRRAALLVMRQAITNALSHGRPETVRVALGIEPGELILEVQDDGAGFDITTVEGSGNGLRNMRYRAAKVGGRLEILATPGAGTRVRLRLPLDPPAPRSAAAPSPKDVIDSGTEGSG